MKHRSAIARHARWLTSRWAVADLLNRLPWTCWADLVTWALEGGRPPVARDGAVRCQSEASAQGSCYCAKFRTQAFQDGYDVAPGVVVPAAKEGRA